MPRAPVLPLTDDAIEAAVQALRAGGTVVFPTDTVYGIGALPGDTAAAHRLFRARRLSPGGSLPVLLASADALGRVAAAVPAPARRLAAAFWPGPLTLVLRRAPGFRGGVAGDEDTVAVRVPAQDGTCRLIAAAGGALAVVAVSDRRPASVTALAASRLVGARVDLILDGGRCTGGVESSIVDCSRTPYRVLREAALTREALSRAALSRFG